MTQEIYGFARFNISVYKGLIGNPFQGLRCFAKAAPSGLHLSRKLRFRAITYYLGLKKKEAVQHYFMKDSPQIFLSLRSRMAYNTACNYILNHAFAKVGNDPLLARLARRVYNDIGVHSSHIIASIS